MLASSEMGLGLFPSQSELCYSEDLAKLGPNGRKQRGPAQHRRQSRHNEPLQALVVWARGQAASQLQLSLLLYLLVLFVFSSLINHSTYLESICYLFIYVPWVNSLLPFLQSLWSILETQSLDFIPVYRFKKFKKQYKTHTYMQQKEIVSPLGL